MQEPRDLVGQIVPKTLAGLAAWLLIFSAGAASSGIVFFAYYRYQLDSVRREVTGFEEKFAKDYQKKTKEFGDLVDESKAEISKAAGGAVGQSEEIGELLEKVGPSIAHIQGVDAAGSPTVASGFVVTSDDSQTWILTTFSAVAGSASAKSPVKVRLASSQRDTNVWSWDEARDLALLILKVGKTPLLDWSEGDPQIGSKVWAIGSAPGKYSASAAQGLLLDVSSEGLLTDADVPSHAAGGPLLARDGKVLGVLSLRYAPSGYTPSNGWAVPVRHACKKVLRCPA